MPFRVREGMDVGVRSSNDIYDPIGQVGWVPRKIVDERWSPYIRAMMQAASSSETSVNSTRQHGAATQKTAIFVLAAVRTSNPAYSKS
jgi:hypothetical protein